ncbi:MAG: galactose mutarotase [Sedimentisphaerales bacterium]|nr:galactose mutarotase [Sedimentisphaerales bacterium]
MKKKFWLVCILALTTVYMTGCKKKAPKPQETEVKEARPMSAHEEPFGQTTDGRQVALYTLTNPNGLRAKITNYGAILVSLEVPDRKGKLADVALGFDSLDGYLKVHPYFGAIVGRYANRIGKAQFTLNGVLYKLAANNNENHLHGGIKGFDKAVWKPDEAKAQGDEAWVKMSYISEDEEEGYPGNLACTVTYTLTKDNELKINYEAETDKTTIINLTNHAYFNLGGQGNGDILSHELMINADNYTPVDEGLIPTGEIRRVRNSPMDFTSPMTIGSRISQVEGGYDHNYVLNSEGGTLALCAEVYEPTSGRVMTIHTTEPGVQFYTGNFLDGTLTGKGNKVYKKHYGFCLETQHFPDSPNRPSFPTVVLEPGQKYTSESIYKFSTR